MMLEVRELGWHEALAQVGAAWSALVAARGLNPSLDPYWMDAAVQSHCLAATLRVLAVFDDGALVAAIPFSRSRISLRGVPATGIDFGTPLVAYHRELVTRSTDPAMLEVLLETCLREPWDLLRFNDVPLGSPTALALESLARKRACRLAPVAGEHSPYIAIEEDWPAYLRTRSKKFRANVTRALRRPSELGSAEMAWFERGADTDRLLADIVAIERRSWKSVAGVAIPDRDYELDYHRRLLPLLADRGMLLANVLYLDGRPVAYVLCCTASGWVGQLKTSFDSAIKDAGAAVVTSSVMRAFEAGAREYDFLGHADAHKLKWTERVREHRGYLLFANTTLGRLHSAVQGIVDRIRRFRRSSPNLAAAPPSDD